MLMQDNYNVFYIVLQPGQYLDISQEDGFHPSFDMHFDLLFVVIETSNLKLAPYFTCNTEFYGLTITQNVIFIVADIYE